MTAMCIPWSCYMSASPEPGAMSAGVVRKRCGPHLSLADLILGFELPCARAA